MLTQTPLTTEQKQALDELPTIWVRNDEQLDKLMDEIDEVDIIALDTEFIKRDTFFPRLALLQVNTGRAIYLLDVPKLDLYDFWQVIADVPTMVLHACGEDLGIYYLLSELPALDNVFDTQIGLSFLTGELSFGYQKALLDTLDIHVDKGESQSDWLQRPLTPEQERYASDDVRYLLALYDEIKTQLTDQHLFDFSKQDSQHYAHELYQVSQQDDDKIYLSVADFRYSREQLAILQALCEWREQLARSINRPRTYILRPQALQEIVEKLPQSLKQLSFTSIKPNVIRMYGQEILKIINDIRKNSDDSYPDTLPIPYRSLADDMQKQLQSLIDNQATIINVPNNVLIRKKWLTDVYAFAMDNNRELPIYLLGWRHDWIIGTLVPAFENLVANKNNDLVENVNP
nr:HRDC domain-containing protein [uncultured Moraxella sp.]